MQTIKNQPPARSPSKPWARPAVKRLEAGAAELNVSGASDGPNNVS